MPDCCIVYTSDQTYLFPTLVSAMQARRHAPRVKADVMIFGVGVTPQAGRDFAAICAREDIGFAHVAPELIEGANAMMSRLFLNRFVPAQYGQYLYIDGDTQVRGPLDPLIDAVVPPGQFMAANDPMTFQLDEPGGDGEVFRRHMRAIGLTPGQAAGYFNTGVLRINRNGWAEIGGQAWALCRQPAGRFRFPDQDPLNIVAADCHTPMSLAWNFPIFMLNVRVEADIRPRIYHFMSSPKPWNGVFPPWDAAARAPYTQAVQRHPDLAAFYPAYRLDRAMRYHVQQRYKKVVETMTWGFGARRQRILRYEAQLRSATPIDSRVAA